jgi:glycosyltransferase involved in cell wall biosynthesis
MTTKEITVNKNSKQLEKVLGGAANAYRLFEPGSNKNLAKPTVCVVIPTLNEEKNLPHVLPRIPDWVDEIVLVDGRSTDNTIEVARQLCPDINVVLEQKPGKGVALRAGFKAASSDIIVMLDADGSTDPVEIPVFVGALLAGADFVKGSRFLQGGGTADMEWYRRWGNHGLIWLVRLLFGGHYSDLCYGYNAFWRSVVPSLQLDADGFEIETLMNVRALKTKMTVAEVPSFEAARIHGSSHLNTMRDGWRILKTIYAEFVPQIRRKIHHPHPGNFRKQNAFPLVSFTHKVRNVHSAELCPTCAQPLGSQPE